MLRIIYTSKATTLVTSELVRLISETSARKNRQVAVTGLLLYGSGNYLQVLEGDAEHVGPLFERIKNDCRHENCQLLHRQATSKRYFKGWQMGLLNSHNKPETEQAREWNTITTMLQVLPNCGVLNSQDDMLDCIREFVDCHAMAAAMSP